MYTQIFHLNLTAINGTQMFLDSNPTKNVVIDITVSSNDRDLLFIKIKSTLEAARKRVAFVPSDCSQELQMYFNRLTCNDSGNHLNDWGIQNLEGWTAYYSNVVITK